MSDTFNVTAAWSKPSYNAGDTITGTIAGNVTSVSTTTQTVGPVIVPVVAADGAQSTVSFPAVSAVFTTTSTLGVTIDTTRAIVDSGPSPRTWVVSADKLSITATA